MNRIRETFRECKTQGRLAFMPFMVAGDPDYATSLEIANVLLPYADFLEIGFPYSDPLADGPTIQAGDQRALSSGMTTDKVFGLITEIRKRTDVPITLLVYANLVYQRGIEKFYHDAKNAGVDAVLMPDLPYEEARPYLEAAKSEGITPIFLVTQTTTPARLHLINKIAQGYFYLVSVLGITGQRKTLANQTITWIKKMQKATKLPLAVGFGISEPEHVAALKRIDVDGVIVGSAIVNIIGKNLESTRHLKKELSRYLKLLTEVL